MSDEGRRKRLMQDDSGQHSAGENEQRNSSQRPRSRLQLEAEDAADAVLHAALQLDPVEAVERILKNPVFEAAPKSFAAKMMARLAKSLRSEQLSLPEEAALALQIELAMVSLITLPLMIAVGYLRVLAEEDPELRQSTTEIIHTLLLMVDSFTLLLTELQALQQTDPERAKLLVALLPGVLENLARAIAPDAQIDAPLNEAEWREMQSYNSVL
jgi:hypothetical protein